MAPKEKLRERIAELISRPLNVDFEEIDWVMKQLGSGESRPTKHGQLYKLPGCPFTLMLNRHNNGRTKLPRYCVLKFRDLMIQLGKYEEPAENE